MAGLSSDLDGVRAESDKGSRTDSVSGGVWALSVLVAGSLGSRLVHNSKVDSRRVVKLGFIINLPDYGDAARRLFLSAAPRHARAVWPCIKLETSATKALIVCTAAIR